MSAVNSTAGTNYLQTTALSVQPDAIVILAGWFWRENTTPNSNNILAHFGEGSTNFRTGVNYNNTPSWRGEYGNGAGDAMGAATHSTWTSVIVGIGPWNNTSQPRRGWLNGTAANSSNITVNTATAFDRLTLFAGNGGTVGARGKVAEIGIFRNPSNLSQLIADLQIYSPTVLTDGYVNAWRLFDNANSHTAGANLNQTNTITYDTGDHPSVSTSFASAHPRSFIGGFF